MGGSVRSVAQRTGESALSPRFVGFTISVFLAFGLGYLLLVFALVFGVASMDTPATATPIAGGLSTTGSFGAASTLSTLAFVFLFSPFVALVMGLFTGVGTNRPVTAGTSSFLGSTLGFLLMAALLVALLGALAGGEFEGIAEVVPLFLLVSLATGATGLVSGLLSNHYQ